MDLILWTAFKGIVLLGLISVGIALVGLYIRLKTKPKPKDDINKDAQNEILKQAVWPYKRKSLLTYTEQRFFALLHEALPEHQIFVQVALNQMIKVDGKQNWAKWYNAIAQMSVDFVISDTKGFIIAAIELDDKSHDNEKRQGQDSKKDKALISAGIQVLRYRCESMPSTNTIQKDIEKIHGLMATI